MQKKEDKNIAQNPYDSQTERYFQKYKPVQKHLDNHQSFLEF